MILTIPRALPSWNPFYAGMHYRKRKAIADLWHDLGNVACQQAKVKMFKKPVRIIVTRYARRTIDCDNVCAKLVIDGLVGYAIKDDSRKYVAQVVLQSEKGDPSTTIEIQEVEA